MAFAEFERGSGRLGLLIVRSARNGSASFPTSETPAAWKVIRRRPCNAGLVTLRCLIVDDNTSFLEAARALLELEGMDVVATVTTGDDALREVVALRPDVVLVDVMLGEESGFDVARRLDTLGCAIVMISTHGAADLADLLTESPARGFLPKSQLSALAIRELLASG